MNVAILGVMIPIIAIIGAFTMVIYLRKFENTERMAMIEKGVDASIFKSNVNVNVALRFSLLLIGAGVGLLMGYWLDKAFDMKEIAYFSMLLLFGGVGLGAAYLVEKKQEKSNQ